MGETEIIVDPMETMPLTSDQEPDLDPLKTGFTWYKAARSLDTTHKSGGHTWTISGHDMQILTSTVPPGEEIITEGTPTGVFETTFLRSILMFPLHFIQLVVWCLCIGTW